MPSDYNALCDPTFYPLTRSLALIIINFLTRVRISVRVCGAMDFDDSLFETESDEARSREEDALKTGTRACTYTAKTCDPEVSYVMMYMVGAYIQQRSGSIRVT